MKAKAKKTRKTRRKYPQKGSRKLRRRNPDEDFKQTLRSVNEGDYTAIPKLYREAIRLGLADPKVSLIPHTINMKKRFSDWHACFDGREGLWAAGENINDAIGGLIRNHYDYIGVKIIYPKNSSKRRKRRK